MSNFNEHFPQLVHEDEINLFWLQLLLFPLLWAPLLWAPLHVRICLWRNSNGPQKSCIM